jgi:hypothetical protein
MRKFVFYSMNESGHRLEYIKFCESALGGSRVSGWDLITTRKVLLFLMVEESFLLYAAVSLYRALLGRKTVGLVFRAKECVKCSSIRLKVKYAVMLILKQVRDVKSLSIVPFFICEGAEKICDDWIYDFQFWDKDFLESMVEVSEVHKTVGLIEAQAQGRKVVCAVGRQDKSKGFDQFVSLYLSSQALREKYLFVSGGKVSGIDEALIEKFERLGGLLINKRISDSELVALYKASDFVWVCYSQQYDQSSGVLGRALQYKKNVIVRKGTIAERLALRSSSLVISFDEKKGGDLACKLNVLDPLIDTNERLSAKKESFDSLSILLVHLFDVMNTARGANE